ncbi:MAG: type II secretion system protein F [bacterium]|nr:type II secretion system protein F [bacterium]
MRRFIIGLGGAVGLLLGGASPALAQSFGGTEGSTLVLVGAIAGGLAFGLFFAILFGPNRGLERDLTGRLGVYADQSDPDPGFFGRIPILRRLARQAESVAHDRGVFTMIETALEQANVPIRPGEAITIAMAVSLGAGIVSFLVSGNIIIALIVAVVMMAVAGAFVQVIAARERAKFADQLPDTLNLISTSLRAGYSLLQAVEAVGSEAADPTGREFSRAITEIRLGRSPVESLKLVAERMESVDFDWAVLAINIQREVGGNLAEVLQTAAETMVERNRLRREMKALTAEGRISAIVLGGLPVGLFVFLYFTNRDYLEPLLTTFAGIGALIGAGLMLVAGVAWLRKIVSVDI